MSQQQQVTAPQSPPKMVKTRVLRGRLLTSRKFETYPDGARYVQSETFANAGDEITLPLEDYILLTERKIETYQDPGIPLLRFAPHKIDDPAVAKISSHEDLPEVHAYRAKLKAMA